jgi:hypothetical protein
MDPTEHHTRPQMGITLYFPNSCHRATMKFS